MQKPQHRVIQSFRRLLGWVSDNWTALVIAIGSGDQGTPSPFEKQRDALQGVVDRVSEHAATQDTQYLQSTLIAKSEVELRNVLRVRHIGAVVQMARTLRGQVPGIGVLAGPPANIQPEPLLRFAVAFAKSATVYQQVLIEHGLPSDFLTELVKATTAVRESVDGRGNAGSRRVGATAGIKQEIALGRRLVAMMDVTVARAFESDPAKLAEWRAGKHVARSVSNEQTSVSSSPGEQTATAESA